MVVCYFRLFHSQFSILNYFRLFHFQFSIFNSQFFLAVPFANLCPCEAGTANLLIINECSCYHRLTWSPGNLMYNLSRLFIGTLVHLFSLVHYHYPIIILLRIPSPIFIARAKNNTSIRCNNNISQAAINLWE